jgi:hypothetical protein
MPAGRGYGPTPVCRRVSGVHGGVPRLGSIDAVRTVAGLLGLITPNTMGAFTRVLLPVAVVAMRVRVIPGRRLT